MLLKHYGSKIILNTLPPINESLINKYYSSYGLTAYKKDWDLYNQIIVNIAKTHGCMLNRPDYVLSVKDVIADGNGIEVKCHFCNTNYKFSTEELKEIRH